jgi:ribulose-phosphate 3-epimerase
MPKASALGIAHARLADQDLGVVINPATPTRLLDDIVQEIDQVLVMTVNPCFGHQPFSRNTLPKIRRVRTLIDEVEPGCDLELERGIGETTAGD